MILVTGATGTIGGEVARQLVAAGVRPRLLVRDPARAAAFEGRAELIQGDLAHPETLRAAFDGTEQLFLVSTGMERRTLERNALAAAKRAGLRHVVKLSVLGADAPEPTLTRWHAELEQALRDSGLQWTMLQPGDFMSNALCWAQTVREQGAFYEVGGEGRFAPIDPADIAAVAVKALTEPGHEGKAYALTGPEALSLADQAAVLSRVLGRTVRYIALSREAARAQLLSSGTPAAHADALLEFSALVEAGKADRVLPTVEQVLGRRAGTFEAWVRRHVAAFH